MNIYQRVILGVFCFITIVGLMVVMIHFGYWWIFIVGAVIMPVAMFTLWECITGEKVSK